MGMTCQLGIWLVVVFDCRKPGLNLVTEYFSFQSDPETSYFPKNQEVTTQERACRVEIPSGPRACGDTFKGTTSSKSKFIWLFSCSLVILTWEKPRSRHWGHSLGEQRWRCCAHNHLSIASRSIWKHNTETQSGPS